MKTRKQITFDLITTEDGLPKHYPKPNWRNAYDDIKQFMKSNGFEWRQGSVYHSKEFTSLWKTRRTLENLSDKHPWLNNCVRDCVVTNISREFNMSNIFCSNINSKVKQEEDNEQKQPIITNEFKQGILERLKDNNSKSTKQENIKTNDNQ